MERSPVYKEKSQMAFDRQAEVYDSTYYGQHARKTYDAVIAAMDRYAFKSVLDIGCGTGNMLLQILGRHAVEAAGIDLSDKMLDIAKERMGTAADLRKGDSEHLPWENGKFDMVICTDSFHHYPNPKAVLREMGRVLAKGGKVVVADPWLPSPFRQIANIFMPFGKDGDIKMYSEREMKKMLEECNLEFISWRKLGRSAFVAVASKG